MLQRIYIGIHVCIHPGFQFLYINKDFMSRDRGTVCVCSRYPFQDRKRYITICVVTHWNGVGMLILSTSQERCNAIREGFVVEEILSSVYRKI